MTNISKQDFSVNKRNLVAILNFIYKKYTEILKFSKCPYIQMYPQVLILTTSKMVILYLVETFRCIDEVTPSDLVLTVSLYLSYLHISNSVVPVVF